MPTLGSRRWHTAGATRTTSRSLIPFAISLVAALHQPVLAAVDIDADEGSLSVRGEGVLIEASRPRVQLLDRTGQLIDWRIDGPPTDRRTTEETTALGPGVTTTLSWNHPKGFRLSYRITQLENHPGALLQCTLKNQSDSAIRLRRFFLLETAPGGLSVVGDPASWMTASRYLKYARYYDTLGDLINRGQLRTDRSNPDDTVRIVPYDEDFTLYTDSGRAGISISAVGDVSFIWTHLHTPPDANRLSLDVTSEMTGVVVDPGESRSSETVLVSTASWKAASEAVVRCLRGKFAPRDTPPLFGWCSWYCAGANVTQEHCRQAARFAAEHQDRYPFQTMQVDEGWSIGRHRWHANDKFDRGLTDLASSFAKTGAMPGVWLCPGTANSQRVIDGELIHTGGSGGRLVRSFDKSWYVGARLNNPNMTGLDPTSPPAAEYMAGELKRLYDQGYRYFKTDFSLVGDLESGYHDPKATHFQAHRQQYQLWRDAIGEDSYLLACNGGPARAILGIADATRIGTDSNQKWAFCYPPNSFGKPSNVHGSWFPILQIGCASFYNRLIACDPDVSRLEDLGNALLDPRFVGENKRASHYQSMDTVQTFHGILSLYGGTMMVSDLFYEEHFRSRNALRMLEIMHPPTPDKGYNFAGGVDVKNTQFGFVAQRDWGSWISMVTWNPSHNSPSDLHVDNAPVDAIGDRFHVWSYWDETYHGVQDRSFTVPDVPKYCSRLLRLTPLSADGLPTLIGSNLHMSMGSAELKRVTTSESGVAIELAPGAGALEGRLVLHSSSPLSVASSTGCDAFVVSTGNSTYTVVITDRKREKRQEVTLRIARDAIPTPEAVRTDEDRSARWRSSTLAIDNAKP